MAFELNAEQRRFARDFMGRLERERVERGQRIAERMRDCPWKCDLGKSGCTCQGLGESPTLQTSDETTETK